ncbi:MAG: hypothetical protein HFI00_05950 [Lachnospiraceae bacterium]|nr:hypothetical protein [Lachnospiraceae bacterium]
MNWISQESAPLCRWKTDCLAFFMIQLYTKEEESVSLFPRATSQVACLNPTKGWIGHLATAARSLINGGLLNVTKEAGLKSGYSIEELLAE